MPRTFFGIDNIGIFYKIDDINFNTLITSGELRIQTRQHLQSIFIEGKEIQPIGFQYEQNLPIYGLRIKLQKITTKFRFFIVISIVKYSQPFIFIKFNPSHYNKKDNFELTGEQQFKILNLIKFEVDQKLNKIGIEIPKGKYANLNALELGANIKIKDKNIIEELKLNTYPKQYRDFKLGVYEKQKGIYRIEIRFWKQEQIQSALGINTYEELYQIQEQALFNCYVNKLKQTDTPIVIIDKLNSIKNQYILCKGSAITV